MKQLINIKKFFKDEKSLTGFTLIELMVAISIIGVLSGIIVFSITKYINKGKDSNLSANLAILIPSGEVYYNANGADGYSGFCETDVVANAKRQMPVKSAGAGACLSDVGFCCSVNSTDYRSWAACVQEFSNPNMAFCIDSRGVKKEICNIDCKSTIIVCPPDLSSCAS